jgi:hypothetical protein
MLRIYKLFDSSASFTTTLDTRGAGRILAVYFSVEAVIAAISNQLRVELSFASSGSFSTNDTVNTIATLRLGANAAGANSSISVNQFIDLGAGMEYAAGERIYLLNNETGSLTSRAVTAHLYCQEGAGGGSGVRDARGRFLQR